MAFSATVVMKIEKGIGDLLRERGWTLSVAESCTGGLVSDRITDIAGSSDYFRGGIASYSVEAKAQHLGIPLKYIERYGAVSPQVARRMAEGVRQAFHTTFGLSTTGVAGPTGGTKKTPVGTVFLGFSDGTRTRTKKVRLHGTRREIKKGAAEQCLRLLHEELARFRINFSKSPLEKGGKGGFSWSTKDASAVRQWIEHLRHSKESEILMIRNARKGISNQRGRLGIFPASFNPPTLAHVALIREAKKQGNLDGILVLLDIDAMDKKPAGAKFEDRLTMVNKVFGRDPLVSIGLSNRGLFLQKLEPLRKYYPSPIPYFFIVGFDTILRVIDTKYYRSRKQSLDALFTQCWFLVANRDQYEERAMDILFRRRENKAYREKVSFIALPSKYSSFSSSLIRAKIKEGESINRLVPSSIRRYIREKGLYAG